MPKVLEFGLRLYRAGVPMMIGTDGSGGGASYVRELALHTDAGIPRWAVLRMATSGSADLLGVGDRTGRIAPGFEADIVFLTADPSRDIANAGKVHGVLNDGDFFSFAELTNGPQ
jgi:imidazolonepropionase-like amidohydrolase